MMTSEINGSGKPAAERDGPHPFFSVVVACCDVEPYLRECLDSVTGQDFADWECIVVVEESKDATERIVREYAARDPRFAVFTQPRSGSPAAPRNTALRHAKGEYVIFLDGDDSIAEGALRRLRDGIAAPTSIRARSPSLTSAME